SDLQWNFQPAEGGWPIASIAEHVAAADASIWQRMQDRILKSAPQPPSAADRMDPILLTRLPARATKASAPADMEPAQRWPTVAQTLAVFAEGRERTIRY